MPRVLLRRGAERGGIPVEGAGADAAVGVGAKLEAAKAQRFHTTPVCRMARLHAQATQSRSTSSLYGASEGAESVVVVGAAKAAVAVVVVAGLAQDSDPFPTQLSSKVGVARTSNFELEGAKTQRTGAEVGPVPTLFRRPSSASSRRVHFLTTAPRCSVQLRPRYRLLGLNVLPPRLPPARTAAGRAGAAGTTPGLWSVSVCGRPCGCESLSLGPPTAQERVGRLCRHATSVSYREPIPNTQ